MSEGTAGGWEFSSLSFQCVVVVPSLPCFWLLTLSEGGRQRRDLIEINDGVRGVWVVQGSCGVEFSLPSLPFFVLLLAGVLTHVEHH
jgi:hypothetical protein